MSDSPRPHVPDLPLEELEDEDAGAEDEVGDRVDPDVEPEPADDLEVEPPAEVDPDLDAARAMAPSQRPDTLKTDELRPEEELIEPEPPDEPSPETSTRRTAAEERTRETLQDRLEQERPDE